MLNEQFKFLELMKGMSLQQAAEALLPFQALFGAMNDITSKKLNMKVVISDETFKPAYIYLCNYFKLPVEEVLTIAEASRFSNSEKLHYLVVANESSLYTPELYEYYKLFFEDHKYLLPVLVMSNYYLKENNDMQPLIINTGSMQPRLPFYQHVYSWYGKCFGEEFDNDYDALRKTEKKVTDEFIKQYKKNIKDYFKNIERAEGDTQGKED